MYFTLRLFTSDNCLVCPLYGISPKDDLDTRKVNVSIYRRLEINSVGTVHSQSVYDSCWPVADEWAGHTVACSSFILLHTDRPAFRDLWRHSQAELLLNL
jgi:hypothetical protein